MKKELLTIKRKRYISPLVESITLSMEHGIAAGSATVAPSNSSAEVLQEWDIGADRDANINW